MFGFIKRVHKVIWRLKRDSSADFLRANTKDERLTLKTLGLEQSLYDGQITLSTPVVKPNIRHFRLWPVPGSIQLVRSDT